MRKLNDPFYEPLRSWLDEIQKDLASKEAQMRAKLEAQTASYQKEIKECEAKYIRNTENLCSDNEQLRFELATVQAQLNDQIEAQKRNSAESAAALATLRARLDIQSNDHKRKLAEAEVFFENKMRQQAHEHETLKAENTALDAKLNSQAQSNKNLTNEITRLNQTIETQAADFRIKSAANETSFQKKTVSISIENEKLKTQIAAINAQFASQTQENNTLTAQISELRSRLNSVAAEYRAKMNSTELALQNRTTVLINENEKLKADVALLTTQMNSQLRKNAESLGWIDSLVKTNAAKEAEVKQSNAALVELRVYHEKLTEQFTRQLAKEKLTTTESEAKSKQDQELIESLEEKLSFTERELRVYKNQIRTIGECVKDFGEINVKSKEIAKTIDESQNLKALIAEERAVFERATGELRDKIQNIEKDKTESQKAYQEITKSLINEVKNVKAKSTSKNLSMDEIERHLRSQSEAE